jgi:excisionase family DNA binding protein
MPLKYLKEYPDVLTTNEVAEILRVHRTTVERKADSGEIKSFSIGTLRRYLKQDIVSLFENQAPEYASKKEA